MRDVLIVGSAPAGYTAAIYTARAYLHPLVIEGFAYGGALMTTTEVENYPGFADGIAGPELMASMRKQAERFGAEFLTDDATALDLTGDVKTVIVGGVAYRARAVILATGSAYRRLGVPGEQRLTGHGVSWCATCDGFFFRGQHIAVVGGGDSALEEATLLTRFAETVTVIHRRDTLRASKAMQQRAFADPKVRFRCNAILGEDIVTGVVVRDVTTGETTVLPANGVFVAIGHDPRSDLVRGQLRVDADGYVEVDAPSTRTSGPGVFACGDLVDHTYRQAITAAGTACAAALDAERYLADQTTTIDTDTAERPTAMSYSNSITVNAPFADTARRLRDELKAEGFGVLTEIDITSTLREKLGEQIEDYVVLGACNPPLAPKRSPPTATSDSCFRATSSSVPATTAASSKRSTRRSWSACRRTPNSRLSPTRPRHASPGCLHG